MRRRGPPREKGWAGRWAGAVPGVLSLRVQAQLCEGAAVGMGGEGEGDVMVSAVMIVLVMGEDETRGMDRSRRRRGERRVDLCIFERRLCRSV